MLPEMKVRTQGKEGVIRRISELHGLRQEEGYESQPILVYSGKGIRSGMAALAQPFPVALRVSLPLFTCAVSSRL